MAHATEQRVGNRQGRRTLLLLVLLLVVVAWGCVEYARRKPAPAEPPRSPSTRMESYNGQPIRVLADFPYRYDPLLMSRESTLDFFVPQGGGELPVLIYLHGGGWIGGDKSGIGPKALSMAASGMIVASVNYRLAPMSGPPNACDDIAAAVAYIRELAPQIGADPDRLAIMGHSAGAHLAALVVCDPRYLATYPGSAEAIRGVVLLDGSAYNVPRMMRSYRGWLFSDVFGGERDLWVKTSPYHYALRRQGLPSMLLVHAENDGIRRRAAQDMGEAISRGGARAIYLSAPEKNHYTVDEDLADPEDRITQQVMLFLRDVLK